MASVSSLLCLTAALTVRPKAGASLEREGKPGASAHTPDSSPSPLPRMPAKPPVA